MIIIGVAVVRGGPGADVDAGVTVAVTTLRYARRGQGARGTRHTSRWPLIAAGDRSAVDRYLPMEAAEAHRIMSELPRREDHPHPLVAAAGQCGCGWRRSRSRPRIHSASTPSRHVIFLPSSRLRAR